MIARLPNWSRGTPCQATPAAKNQAMGRHCTERQRRGNPQFTPATLGRTRWLAMTGKLFGHFHDPLLRRPPANSDRGYSRRSAPEHPFVRTAQGASRCLVRRDRPAATQALSQASDPTLRSGEPGAKTRQSEQFQARRQGARATMDQRFLQVPSSHAVHLCKVAQPWATLVVVGGSTAGRPHPRQLSRHFITNKPKNFRRSFNRPNTFLCIYWRLPHRSVAVRSLFAATLERRSREIIATASIRQLEGKNGKRGLGLVR
jgi:hypothetical protein